MTKRINLALLYGGKSGEHEISLRSAASVLANLDPARYSIIPVGMDKAGCFFINDYNELLNYSDSLPVSTTQSQPMASLVSNGRLIIDADVVFPVVHGPLYEDGCLQGMLALAGVAYVGCDVLSSAIGMNKDVARQLVAAKGVQSARYRVFSACATFSDLEKTGHEAVAELGWPLFVKPCAMGSSVGIHKVTTMDELVAAVKDASRFDSEVLIEEFIQGREIEVAVLENKNPAKQPRISIPGEIKVCHVDGFYSYMAKYIESDSTDLVIPAQMSEVIKQRLQEAACEIFKTLKCKGLSRVDFFYNEEKNEFYFNEINSMPGFTTISMYPKLWEASGLSYSALLDELIEIAQRHHQKRSELITHYQ